MLLQHHPVVAHLVLAGGEVTMPEQGELLFEGPLTDEHAIGPPQSETLRFDLVGRKAVEELVDHGLQPTLRADWEHLLAEAFAVFARDANRFGTARRKRIHAGIPDHRFVERLQRVGDRLVVDQMVDGLLRRHGRHTNDLVRRCPKARTPDKVRCGGVGPVACRNRREVVGPVWAGGRRSSSESDRRDE